MTNKRGSGGERIDMSVNFVTDRPLPSSADTERHVIGAIQLDNDMMDVARDIIGHEDFYNPLNRKMFRAMEALHDEGQLIDPIHIAEKIKATEGVHPDSLGGVATITQMTMGLSHFDRKTMTKHCQIVKKKSLARTTIKLCAQITAECLDEEEEIGNVLESAETRILAVVNDLNRGGQTGREGFYDLSEITPQMQAQFEAYNRGETNGVSTGMKEVDDKLDGGGLQKQGVYLVAASEKAGKTSLALDWTYNVSMVQGHRSLVSTGEMNRVTLAKRIYSAHTGIPFFMFRPGFSDSREYKAYSQAISGLKDFGKIPIKIAEDLTTMGKIERHFRRAVEQGHKPNQIPVELAVIDYLQLVELDGIENNGNRADVVSKISRRIKKLAASLDIPIVVMSSLNRLGLTEGQRPDTFNLRESQQLAFDAEAVFFLHNPAYVPGKPYTPQEVTSIDLIIARQRNGPTGDIPLRFIGPYMQFMTETQYASHIGDTSKDTTVPQSTGQKIKSEEDLSSLWD